MSYVCYGKPRHAGSPSETGASNGGAGQIWEQQAASGDRLLLLRLGRVGAPGRTAHTAVHRQADDIMCCVCVYIVPMVWLCVV